MQEKDIADCFKMLDEDGSGALDIHELVKAFKMLGFKVKNYQPGFRHMLGFPRREPILQ